MIYTESRHIADYKYKWVGKQKKQVNETEIILQHIRFQGYEFVETLKVAHGHPGFCGAQFECHWPRGYIRNAVNPSFSVSVCNVAIK